MRAGLLDTPTSRTEDSVARLDTEVREATALGLLNRAVGARQGGDREPVRS